ncbi:MAG: Hsp70 family protein, partial [Candidatus Eisenbacteria bacterium]|nr:Hsp70 family protein [Candidatus Eisenbacteria bacterium]
MMGRAIGIDLGATRTIAAVWDEAPRVLLNRESQDFTPSAVGTYKKQICVGQLALDRMLLAPRDTILSVRRLMGQGLHAPAVEEVRRRHMYAIVEPSDGTDDDLRVVMDGKQYSPIEISAMILKKA